MTTEVFRWGADPRRRATRDLVQLHFSQQKRRVSQKKNKDRHADNDIGVAAKTEAAPPDEVLHEKLLVRGQMARRRSS